VRKFPQPAEKFPHALLRVRHEPPNFRMSALKLMAFGLRQRSAVLWCVRKAAGCISLLWAVLVAESPITPSNSGGCTPLIGDPVSCMSHAPGRTEQFAVRLSFMVVFSPKG
jgi:hypothetical protein